MIRINNLKLSIFEDSSILDEKIAKVLKISKNTIQSYKIIKESIDARKADQLNFIYHVAVTLPGVEERKVLSKLHSKDVMELKEDEDFEMKQGTLPLRSRPVIIGTGPAGLFAGLFLAQKGYRPILLERGGDVEERTKKVHHFWATNELDTETNVQFGEGGAGTFSDGKLTTRINDSRCQRVLEELVSHGAPEKILFKAKPHIGTDILKNVVKNIRNQIIELGGEVHFKSKVTDLLVKDGRIQGVVMNESQQIESEIVVLAIGHSARDTYEMLLQKGIEIHQKPFSIGVRIEHPQSLIDQNQYGNFAGHPKLGPAEYQLSYQSKISGRGVYSFCMCPGGTVVAAASEEHTIVTNGMREFARDQENANSALVVSVGPEDFGSRHPLAGVEFQRQWERLAYKVGGGNYHAPMQLVGDFLDHRPSRKLGTVGTSFTGKVTPTDLRQTLPSYVTNTMVEGINFFDRKIKGYAGKEMVMVGVETRTSAPIRIVRSESFEAAKMEGLYPAGEGAGYAGGIMSAAVDGLKIGEAIYQKYALPK